MFFIVNNSPAIDEARNVSFLKSNIVLRNRMRQNRRIFNECETNQEYQLGGSARHGADVVYGLPLRNILLALFPGLFIRAYAVLLTDK